jgi:hypothetical protein
MSSAVVLALLWTVVLWRAPTLLQDKWKRAPWIALAALAVALTASTPPVTRAADRAAGIADLTTLILHLSGIIASAAVLDWVSALSSPRRVRWLRGHRAAAAAAMACMTALFTVMPRPETADYASTVTGGAGAAYLMVFYLYLGAAMSAAAVLFWRVSRVPAHGTLRCGLWLLAAGTSCGALYAGYQAGYLILRVSGAIGAAAARTALEAGTGIEHAAILMILAGISLPAFGVAWQAWKDLLSLRALRDIWQALVTAVPDITAEPWEQSLSAAVRYPHVRLIRRTAEIRDAA